MFREQILKNILEWCYSKLTFHDHFDTLVFTKARKTIGLLRKLNSILPRAALVTVKTFVRPHLDYGFVLYDQLFNSVFQN